MTASEGGKNTVDLLVYSDDVDTRKAVISAVGKRPGKGMPEIRWTEAATGPGAKRKISEGNFPLVILDGEASKVGGMVIAQDLLTEFDPVPEMIIITARPQDAWLATWAKATKIVSQPIDPIVMQEAVTDILKSLSVG